MGNHCRWGKQKSRLRLSGVRRAASGLRCNCLLVPAAATTVAAAPATTTPPAAAPAATATVPAATATTAAPFLTRTGLIHRQGSAAEHRAIQGRDRRVRPVTHLHETEASRPARFPVLHDLRRDNR